MKIYHVTKISVKKLTNISNGISNTIDYSRDGVIVTEDLIVDSEQHYDEIIKLGTATVNSTVTTGIKVHRVDEYENVNLGGDPGRFYNYNSQSWLRPCEDTTKDKLNKIPALVDLMRPYNGRGVYLGEKNGMKFFVTPEVVGDSVRFTSLLTA